MNIVLWVLQVVLALFFVAGGAYKLMKADEIVKQQKLLTPGLWRVIGVVEVLGGVLLVTPPSVAGVPSLTAIAALLLAGESLVLTVIYGRRSMKMVAANPLVWALGMTVVSAFIAWGRYPA
jgi:drug/metabolite transporter (DMT)-like permease